MFYSNIRWMPKRYIRIIFSLVGRHFYAVPLSSFCVNECVRWNIRRSNRGNILVLFNHVLSLWMCTCTNVLIWYLHVSRYVMEMLGLDRLNRKRKQISLRNVFKNFFYVNCKFCHMPPNFFWELRSPYHGQEGVGRCGLGPVGFGEQL